MAWGRAWRRRGTASSATGAPPATRTCRSRRAERSRATPAAALAPPSVTIWRALLLALFFLSGVSGLLYEVAWTRMLHLLFGDTVLAVSTVLASFMAGLALGSFWVGRSIDHRPRVLTLYAALEAGIAVAAVLLPVALQALTPLYVWLHQQLQGAYWLFALVRFIFAFCLLCVPTSLMGATLPVLSRFMVRNQA